MLRIMTYVCCPITNAAIVARFLIRYLLGQQLRLDDLFIIFAAVWMGFVLAQNYRTHVFIDLCRGIYLLWSSMYVPRALLPGHSKIDEMMQLKTMDLARTSGMLTPRLYRSYFDGVSLFTYRTGAFQLTVISLHMRSTIHLDDRSCQNLDTVLLSQRLPQQNVQEAMLYSTDFRHRLCYNLHLMRHLSMYTCGESLESRHRRQMYRLQCRWLDQCRREYPTGHHHCLPTDQRAAQVTSIFEAEGRTLRHVRCRRLVSTPRIV